MRRKIHAIQETRKGKIKGINTTNLIFRETPGECQICGKKIEIGKDLCETHKKILIQVFDGRFYEYVEFLHMKEYDDPFDLIKKAEIEAIEANE